MARQKRKSSPEADALSEKLGQTIQRLRMADKLSLGELSTMSGVAKSMISQIERNETNPTLATVSRLSQALGVSFETVFATQSQDDPFIAHTKIQDTPLLKSEDGLCELRIIGWIETVQWAQWYDFRAEPGGILESSPHPDGSVENLTVLQGCLSVTVDGETWTANAGETLRYRADREHKIENTGKVSAHATMVNILAHAIKP